jgi:hypothetical protein
MHRVTRLVAVTVLTLGLTPLLQGQSWACSCVGIGPEPTEAELYTEGTRAAKVVYVGTVASLRKSPGGPHVYRVAVREPIKGPRVSSYDLPTAEHGGICGVTLTLRRPILVLHDGKSWLSSCGDLTTQHRVTARAAIARAAAGPALPRTGIDVAPYAATLGATALLALRLRRRDEAELGG